MWHRYVAMGDSFTEGLDDLDPVTGHFRGWTDIVAARLAVEVPDFTYANLAIRGRLFAPLVAQQLPVAQQLRPDLVGVAAGGIAALRRGVEPALLTAGVDGAAGQT